MKISQRAREAAADYLGDPFIRAGLHDGHSLVQAFQAVIDAERAETLERAAKVAGDMSVEWERSAEKAEYADHRQQDWNYATGARLVGHAIRELGEQSNG